MERKVRAGVVLLLLLVLLAQEASVQRFLRALCVAEALVSEQVGRRVCAVIGEVEIHLRPLDRPPLCRGAADEAARPVGQTLVLEVVQRIVVLRAATLEVGADEQPSELVPLLQVGDRRRTGETEERPTAVFLVEPIFSVASVVRAQSECPIMDDMIDVEARALALEPVQELDRATLIEHVAAGVVRSVSGPTPKVEVLLPERFWLGELLDGVKVGPRPALVLEHVPEWVTRRRS